MRSRPAVVVATGLALLALAGCGTDGAGPGLPLEEQPAELVLPEDAVLGLVGIATAANGATADVAVIVHASLPYLVPEAADALATTLDWCAGEVDEGVVSGRGFSFTQIDVSLTPREGDWPADATLAVLPQPNPEFGSTIAAGEGLIQVDASDDESLGEAVPHCLQPAVLEGAGGGTVYLGIPSDIAGANDAESFTAWAFHAFGLSSVLPGDLGEADVEFSSCVASITQLGAEFGAPSPTWAERFDATGCIVGGVNAG